jgi:hypothetical protein
MAQWRLIADDETVACSIRMVRFEPNAVVA